MASIRLKGTSVSRDTLVPNKFIDDYMPEANGEFVKVYLYLLRAMSSHMDISISNIADIFDHTEKDIVRALRYWQKLGLIHIQSNETDEISEIVLQSLDTPSAEPLHQDSAEAQPESSASAHSSASTQSPLTSDTTVSVSHESEISNDSVQPNDKPQKRAYTSDEIRAFRGKPDVSEFLYLAEKYLAKPLSMTDVNTILFIYDELKFDAELIEYLLEYCVENNHRSLHYIEKVAMEWADEGITSVEDAQASAELYSKTCYPVLKAFGIRGRNPVKGEKSMIIKWTDTYGFPMDIILDACDRTMNAIHTPSFEYADSILSSWSKKGVKSLDDIKELDLARANRKKASASQEQTSQKNSFNNFEQRDFSQNYDSLEKKLLQKSRLNNDSLT